MLYAYNGQVKSRAYPGATGVCPECGEEVKPRCGAINVWHWSHIKQTDCDLWGEHETAWHLYWKMQFPQDQVEVSLTRDGIRHRADILLSSGWVIELQHSPISVAEILDREQFYGKMMWLFDAREPYQNDRILLRKKDSYYTFRWKQPRKHIGAAQQMVFLDLGNTLFRIKRIYTESPCAGWGFKVDPERFGRTIND